MTSLWGYSSSLQLFLAGFFGWWFQIVVIFTLNLREMIQFGTYFSNGLKTPTCKGLWPFSGNFVSQRFTVVFFFVKKRPGDFETESEGAILDSKDVFFSTYTTWIFSYRIGHMILHLLLSPRCFFNSGNMKHHLPHPQKTNGWNLRGKSFEPNFQPLVFWSVFTLSHIIMVQWKITFIFGL